MTFRRYLNMFRYDGSATGYAAKIMMADTDASFDTLDPGIGRVIALCGCQKDAKVRDEMMFLFENFHEWDFKGDGK